MPREHPRALSSLTNTAKHAHASQVHITVDAQDDVLQLSIRDDGRGGADPTRGSGLTGLTDRVDALGGTIKVASPLGQGTTLLVTHQPRSVAAPAEFPGQRLVIAAPARLVGRRPTDQTPAALQLTGLAYLRLAGICLYSCPG